MAKRMKAGPLDESLIIQSFKDADLLADPANAVLQEAGERLAASYVNFYIGNQVVLVPQFGDEHDVLATDLLQKLFPEREIVPVFAREIIIGGGNIHCITQQIPVRR